MTTIIKELVDSYNSLTEEGRVSFKNQVGLMDIPKILTVHDRLMYFGNVARGKNFPLYYNNETGTDPDIKAWHPNAKISILPIPKGSYQMAPKEGKKEKEFLAEAEANGLVFPSLDLSIQKHTIDLEAGVFDKLETYRCIFYKEDGVVRKLWCRRYSDGGLCLYVRELYPGCVHYAPREFFCSNNEN